MLVPRTLPSAISLLLILFVVASLSLRGTYAQSPEPLPPCEWCGATEAPPDVSWTTTIAGPEEPGDPLITPENRSRLRVIELTRDADGMWRGTRDIVLDP